MKTPSLSSNSLPFVSIVVIGRNESDNLDHTFHAIGKMDYPQSKLELIYVDTGSSDNSVEIARKYTGNVYEEHSVWPSSGLARNRGIQESGHEIIHFIDGDIAIDPDYLKKAIKQISEPGVDAVTGYFTERDMNSYFNRIMAIRRDGIDHKKHFCESTNGGGTYLKKALIHVDGYDERILKGQESELGYRFREAGYKIIFIDSVQGSHNFDLNGWADFFKSKYVYGRSYGFILKLKEDINPFIKGFKKAAVKVLINNTFSVLLILVCLLINAEWVILLYYLLRVFYLYTLNKIIKRRTHRQLTYSFMQYLFSFATYLGILSVLLNPRYKPLNKQRLKKMPVS